MAEAYKCLWRVERAFLVPLSRPWNPRPVRHWAEPRIGGHVVVCFLDSLAQVQQVDMDVKGISLRLITESPPLARRASRSALPLAARSSSEPTNSPFLVPN